MRHARGLRYRDHAVLADYPCQRDLRRGRVVSLGYRLQDRMRVRKQAFLDRRVRDDRPMAFPHPGDEVPLDAASLEVVQHLVRDDTRQSVLEPRELVHVGDVEVAHARVADLLRLQQVVKSGESLL